MGDVSLDTTDATSTEERLRQRVAALEHQLEQQGRFFALSHDLLSVAGFDGYFQRLNAAWSSTLGHSEAELLARPYLDFIHPDDIEATCAEASALTAGPGARRFENRYRCADGSYRWLEWHSVSLPEQRLVYSVVRDITSRKLSEADLRRQSEVFQLILDSMSEGVIVVDTGGRAKVFNPAAERLFGPVSGEVSQDEWSQHYGNFLPDAVTPFPAEELPMVRALNGLESREVEMFVRHAGVPQGLRVTVNGQPLRDQAGQLVGGMVVCRDVTPSRQAQERLRESESRLTQFLNALPVGVFVLDAYGRPCYVNQAATDLNAHVLAMLDDLIDADPDFQVCVAGTDQPYPPECVPLTQALQGEQGRIDDLEMRQGGVSTVLEVIGTPIFAPDGQVSYALAVIRDITERRLAQEAIAQRAAQEAVIRAQAATLYELSTPLLAISDRVVVMPLIGAVDSRRAQQVLEVLLDGIAQRRASVAIIDITGVMVVDTQVANALIRAAQAANLLGAEVLLTGIRPDIAQTLVSLGVDLGRITTRSTLQDGITRALLRGKPGG